MPCEREIKMRLAIVLMIVVATLTGCGKRPNTIENIEGSTYPHPYPTPEQPPGN